MAFAIGLIALQACFAAYTSWLSLTRPAHFAGLLGLTLPAVSGVNEIRSQYGGFFLAMAATQALALAGVLPLEAGLLIGATTFGGLAAGRLCSLAVDRGSAAYTPTIRLLVLLDPLAFLLSLAAFWTLR